MGRVEDRIRGLRMGADDYLCKPFQIGELLARVESVLRRTGAPAWAFTALLTELVNRCYYRMGGDFPFYFSALTPRVERLALRLMGERFTDYEEHTCSLAVPGGTRT